MAAITITSKAQFKNEEVFQKAGVPKSELMLRCGRFTSFMHSTFKAEALTDTLNGSVTYNYAFPYNTTLFGASYINGSIKTTLHLYFKDGRYKVVFQMFEHIGNSKSYGVITDDEQCPRDRWEPLASEKYSTKRWNDIKAVISDHIPLIKQKLLQEIDKPSEKSDNW